MPAIRRNRLLYGILTIVVLLLGLVSRRFFGEIPFVRSYVGDGLWALMVFFGFALVFNRWPVRTVALATLLFSFGIEVSQLYHAPWIDDIRATRLGGLILGFSFVWSDLLCYSLGSAVGFLVETVLIPSRYRTDATLLALDKK
ncbi:ribosomal maturation YjgA family protein [Spirosoma jeollabukense]